MALGFGFDWGLITRRLRTSMPLRLTKTLRGLLPSMAHGECQSLFDYQGGGFRLLSVRDGSYACPLLVRPRLSLRVQWSLPTAAAVEVGPCQGGRS